MNVMCLAISVCCSFLWRTVWHLAKRSCVNKQTIHIFSISLSLYLSICTLQNSVNKHQTRQMTGNNSNDSSLSPEEQLELLNQNITLLLQEIDANMATSARVVAMDLLQRVEELSQSSRKVIELLQPWLALFESLVPPPPVDAGEEYEDTGDVASEYHDYGADYGIDEYASEFGETPSVAGARSMDSASVLETPVTLISSTDASSSTVSSVLPLNLQRRLNQHVAGATTATAAGQPVRQVPLKTPPRRNFHGGNGRGSRISDSPGMIASPSFRSLTGLSSKAPNTPATLLRSVLNKAHMNNNINSTAKYTDDGSPHINMSHAPPAFPHQALSAASSKMSKAAGPRGNVLRYGEIPGSATSVSTTSSFHLFKSSAPSEAGSVRSTGSDVSSLSQRREEEMIAKLSQKYGGPPVKKNEKPAKKQEHQSTKKQHHQQQQQQHQRQTQKQIKMEIDESSDDSSSDDIDDMGSPGTMANIERLTQKYNLSAPSSQPIQHSSLAAASASGSTSTSTLSALTPRRLGHNGARSNSRRSLGAELDEILDEDEDDITTNSTKSNASVASTASSLNTINLDARTAAMNEIHQRHYANASDAQNDDDHIRQLQSRYALRDSDDSDSDFDSDDDDDDNDTGGDIKQLTQKYAWGGGGASAASAASAASTSIVEMSKGSDMMDSDDEDTASNHEHHSMAAGMGMGMDMTQDPTTTVIHGQGLDSDEETDPFY
ncbi:hypothetical protein GQ42DRAFT_18665 [Ramicandelaber brevisporus]|nr:hypothetical protein GQ42DRAFT_18665 [Ramicandelaber brevisporus]